MTPTATLPTPTPTTYGQDASIMRFSVARYQRMIETGIITPEDQVELLENYVVLKMPSNPPHAGTIRFMTGTLVRATPAGWSVGVQLTVSLPDSEPEPDFGIVRGDTRTYLTRHPNPNDIGLLIEVANTSLLRDRRDKARIYARAGIAVYWIVNLEDQRIEVYTQPSGPTAAPSYGNVVNYLPGDVVPLMLDGVTVGTLLVSDLLP